MLDPPRYTMFGTVNNFSAQNTEGTYKIFNDAIHGQIAMPALCVAIIDTPEFQRLRYIKQVGMTAYVYPGGNHTRFEHCLGVGHLAGLFVKSLKERQPELGINERDVLCAQVAGLCHDLGHGPFSHTWQRFLEMKNVKSRASNFKSQWRHEQMSVDLFDYICKNRGLDKSLEDHFGTDYRKYLEIVKQQINGTDDSRLNNKWQVGDDQDKSYLYEIVANNHCNIDVDKWDYLNRDCRHMGFTYYFDHARLISLALVLDCTDGQKHICFSKKVTLNIEEMFHIRWKLHRQAYRHKVVTVLDRMLLDAFCLADSCITVEGEDGMERSLSAAANDTVAFTKLVDHIFQTIIHAKPVAGTGNMEDLQRAQEILTRIECRKLYGHVHDYIAIDATLHKKVKENPINIRKEIFQNLRTNNVKEVEKKHGTILNEDDLHLEVSRFDYGDTSENPTNPLHKVWFYDKLNPYRGERVKPKQVSKMFPEEYEETLLLCFCFKNEFTEVVRIAFDEWLKHEIEELKLVQIDIEGDVHH